MASNPQTFRGVGGGHWAHPHTPVKPQELSDQGRPTLRHGEQSRGGSLQPTPQKDPGRTPVGTGSGARCEGMSASLRVLGLLVLMPALPERILLPCGFCII